ncbi:MAG TPA: hypothetical protein VMX13_09160 [Sedimentisphaerales bacterium]|nr:hypothetical protein [Sedimentisphaerales bacterium]
MKFEEKREKSGRPAVVAFATKTRGEAGGGMNIQGGTRNPPEADKCRIRRRRTSVEGRSFAALRMTKAEDCRAALAMTPGL